MLTAPLPPNIKKLLQDAWDGGIEPESMIGSQDTNLKWCEVRNLIALVYAPDSHGHMRPVWLVTPQGAGAIGRLPEQVGNGVTFRAEDGQKEWALAYGKRVALIEDIGNGTIQLRTGAFRREFASLKQARRWAIGHWGTRAAPDVAAAR